MLSILYSPYLWFEAESSELVVAWLQPLVFENHRGRYIRVFAFLPMIAR